MLKSINLPTWITISRLLLLPVILFFYAAAVSTEIEFFINYGKLIAALIFVVAVATDWLDGWVARKFNKVSDFGKLLDHNADKMLTTLGFLLIIADPIWYSQVGFEITNQVPNVMAVAFWFIVPFVFIAFARDIVMSTLRAEAARRGTVIAADRLGKTKSLCQFLAITLYMLLAWNLNPMVMVLEGEWINLWSSICIALVSFATVLSVWSCVNYIRNYVKGEKAKTKGEVTNGNDK